MRRGRILIFVVLILVIGLVVAGVAIRQFLLTQTAQTAQASNVEIYIAGQNIPQGGEITEAVLSKMTIPQDKVIDTEFTAPDELSSLTNGKVAKFPLEQGVVLTASMISEKSSAVSIAGPSWASLIPPGMTAISIPTNRLSLVSYGIGDGAHVNINACFLFVDIDPTFQTILPNLTATVTGVGAGPDALPVLSLGIGGAGGPQGRLELEPTYQQPYYLVPSEAQRPRMVCQMLLQNVTVMKLGNFPLSTTTSATAPVAPTDPAAQQAPVLPDIVTLIVSPQDSVTLSYLVYTNTQIMMALRNPSDDARQATEASVLQFLLSQYNIPVPAKLPYAMQPALNVLVAPSLPNDTASVPPQ